MRSLGRGSVTKWGVVLLAAAALCGLLAPSEASAQPTRTAQPHYCGMVKGTPWTIKIRKATGGFDSKSGNTYAVSSGWDVFGCAYAMARAASLTHVATSRLRSIRFPKLRLTCSRIGPEDVDYGPLAVYGWCGRPRNGSKIAASVYFFWSPSGDPLQ